MLFILFTIGVFLYVREAYTLSVEPKLRIVEYQDNSFVIERASPFIPFLWRKDLQVAYGGRKIEWAYSNSDELRFKTFEKAKEKLDIHYSFLDSVKRKKSRKRIVNFKRESFNYKRSSEIIQEMKTAKGDKLQQLIREMEEMH